MRVRRVAAPRRYSLAARAVTPLEGGDRRRPGAVRGHRLQGHHLAAAAGQEESGGEEEDGPKKSAHGGFLSAFKKGRAAAIADAGISPADVDLVVIARVGHAEAESGKRVGHTAEKVIDGLYCNILVLPMT